MGRPTKRRRQFNQTPTFAFQTRELRGVSKAAPADQEQWDKLKAEWLTKHRPHKIPPKRK